VCGQFRAFFPSRPDWEPDDALTAALAPMRAIREPAPPWVRLFQLSAGHPWRVVWRHAPVACDRCGQNVVFAAWTRPRFGVAAHNTLCLACGFAQVGYVYRDRDKREPPVQGGEWTPACVAVARLRRAIFDQQRFWTPPPDQTLAEIDDDEDGEEDASGY
jgi:hypothetical protein